MLSVYYSESITISWLQNDKILETHENLTAFLNSGFLKYDTFKRNCFLILHVQMKSVTNTIKHFGNKKVVEQCPAV